MSSRSGCENEQPDGVRDDPNSSINESIASSESSLGVNRLAKARVMFTGETFLIASEDLSRKISGE